MVQKEKSPRSKVKNRTAAPSRKKAAARRARSRQRRPSTGGKFPRHSVEKALRIPRAILEQNAGRPCTPKEAASFLGVQHQGPFGVEVSSAKKYGFLEAPEKGKIQPSDLARQILRPQTPGDELSGYRRAVFNAPEISDVYEHYRGENLPDDQFLRNTVVQTYKIPEDKFLEFKSVLIESLQTARLISTQGESLRVLDVSSEEAAPEEKSERLKKLGRGVEISATDSCFVVQPFAPPLGNYYEKIYRPAIEKAGLTPVRADTEIFGAGKIMDQVFRGIHGAKVLVAELTNRNPNVFYELGLAHALSKPVVLVSSNEGDVPFDLKHIRVIYYDVNDPFWGSKLIEKIAENILSAIQNPEEAIFKIASE